MDKLKLDIPYQQKAEIIVEFPLSVLGEYNGISNLDTTWDDNIMPIIEKALRDCGFNLKNSPGEFKFKDEKFIWMFSLVINPPSVDFTCIINSLTEEKFSKGILIKIKKGNDDFETIYSDNYYS